MSHMISRVRLKRETLHESDFAFLYMQNMAAVLSQESVACNEPLSSSVDAMSVADVRRALSHIRKSWEEQFTNECSSPFYISNEIAVTSRQKALSVEAFSLMFVLAHHTRRLYKS